MAVFGHVSRFATVVAGASKLTKSCCSGVPGICLVLASPVWVLTSLTSPYVHRDGNVIHPPWCIGGIILRSSQIICLLTYVSLEKWPLGTILAKGILKVPLGSEPRVSLVASCTNGFH